MNLEIRQVPVASLRLHQVHELIPEMSKDEWVPFLTDVREHGIREPLKVQGNNILDGRMRYKAAQELGLQQVPVTEAALKGESPTLYALKSALLRRQLSTSQRAMLAAELEPVFAKEAKARAEQAPGRPRGIKKSPMANLPWEKTEHTARAQAAATLNVGARSVQTAKAIKKKSPSLAQEIREGNKTLARAASELRKEENIRKEREALSQAPLTDRWVVTSEQTVMPCNALITDPPYGILDQPWEPPDLRQFTSQWLKRWNECGADFIAVFWSQAHLWEGRDWFDEALTAYQFQQCLVWHYPNNKSPQSRQGFKQTWEPIFFYRKRGSEKKVRVGGSEWGKDLHDFDCHVAAVPQSNFKGQDMKQHPAQKPVSVFRWLISALTQPSELVCDPFCGSGASGIAALQLRRKYHGIEINPDYVELAKRRIAAYGQL